MNDMRQPSLFDQLTPDDSLRSDLDWIDSLREQSEKETKPSRRRGRKDQPAVSSGVSDPITGTPDMPLSAEPVRTEPMPVESPVQQAAPSSPPKPSPEILGKSDTTPDGLLPSPERPSAEDGTSRDSPPVPLPDEPAMPGPCCDPPSAKPSDSDIAASLPDELEAVSDSDTDRSGVTIWVKRILVAVATLMLLLVAFALVGSHSAATKSQEVHDRLQTSMSRLQTATKNASMVRTKAG